MSEDQPVDHVHSSSRCPCRPTQRRSHKKSRNGCRNCKQRRVKCDENKPVCGNCSRCSIPCDFDVANASASLPAAIVPRRRGRPLKWTSSPDDQATKSTPGQSELREPDLSALGPEVPLNVQDMQLFYHFITTTSLTLGDDVLWHDKVPRLAFEHHYILRLMLAMSALHLSRLRAIEASKYEELAEAHASVALRQVTELLPHVSRKNCSALYIATVLVCNYTFAKPPGQNHFLLVAEGTKVAWWNLFRGVRIVIETMGLPAIFSGVLGPFPPENTTKLPPIEDRQGYIPWEGPMSSLDELISGSKEPGLKNIKGICEGLIDCFRGVYGTAEQPESETHGKMHIVMRWLWLLEDDFLHQVNNMIPQALLLLGHFAVLIQTVECFWFMKGWAYHIVEGIQPHLGSDYIGWIAWPRRQVEQ
ncbi:hypothetical protein CEP51_003627 [Fusarium floridanum]|uniref:Zn(2)-C6 fungal-type domain-containing protein n=1 Tax=Fusarium floridanum TaxID=1325733 RepID=A0A428S545_9HYPO|nr:hypothetical protein CEP51_003627 [Fusarium floridanum]